MATLIATPTLDSLADIRVSLASPEGLATGVDRANFATGGGALLIADTRSVRRRA